MSRKGKLVCQKLFGLVCLAVSVFYFVGFVGENDITPVFLLAPLGLYLVFTKEIVL